MNIPPKYEDVVAELDAALGREAALREELESIKASVDGYDSPEHAAQVADEMGHQCIALQQRLTVAEQLLQETSKAILRHQAEQPMSKRLSGLLTKARASVDRHLKGAALKPAEGEVS